MRQVRDRCGEQAAVWIDEAAARLDGGRPERTAPVDFTAAGRRLRGLDFVVPGESAEDLARAGIFGAGQWTAARAFRSGLLVRCLHEIAESRRVDFVRSLYRTGDNDERVAILGALCVCPGPQAYVETAVDACRTHIAEIFEAIACENAYPSEWFPEASFNQMVIKAVFTEIPLRRVVGVERRMNSELIRMASDYSAERRAAGRAVSDDLRMLAASGG